MIIQQLRENFNCPICFFDFKGGSGHRVTEKITHIFCRSCLEDWLTRDSSCPVCRATLQRPVEVDPEFISLEVWPEANLRFLRHPVNLVNAPRARNWKDQVALVALVAASAIGSYLAFR